MTLNLEKGGDVLASVVDVRTVLDSDGDGLTDNEEREGFRLGYGETVSTFVHDEDSDGDGLDDSEEVIKTTFHSGFTYFSVLSNPRDPHSDDDGIDDWTEQKRGWSVNVINETFTVDGETHTGPYRYDHAGETNDEVTFHSDPLFEDTDRDGLTDQEEKEETSTNPERQITYSITHEHQAEIVDALYQDWQDGRFGTQTTVASLGIGPSGHPAALGDLRLDDATDDFDFVRADDGDLVFTALDGTDRTDTWLANREELERDLDPWDPDHDDDGLTDGQEVKWVTVDVGSMWIDVDRSIDTEDLEPGDPDSDGDGYWDGWIGVHGVGQTDNVVLYMEHLQTGNGIEGDEIVQEQAGTHMWQDDEHSNIHIGELQWGTDPSARADVPAPSLSIEVDYYHGANYEPLADPSWGDGIEANYDLYDIDVTVIEDEVLEEEDFLPCIPVLFNPACVDPENGFGYREIAATGAYHKSTEADEYVLIANKAGGLIPDGESQTGVNLAGFPYQAIFVEGHQRFTNNVPAQELRRSPYSSELAMVTAKTQIHEIGHSFHAGEDDDRSLLEDPVLTFERRGEVYSGGSDPIDPTPEPLQGRREWSVMAAGWDNDMVISPMRGRYFAYSIEELSTVQP